MNGREVGDDHGVIAQRSGCCVIDDANAAVSARRMMQTSVGDRDDLDPQIAAGAPVGVYVFAAIDQDDTRLPPFPVLRERVRV